METMNRVPMAYKILIGILTLAVIVLGVAFLAQMKKNQTTEKQPAQQEVSKEVKEQLLQTFPPDFVVDKEAKEIANDVSADGQKITRVFQSQQTPDQLQKGYTDVMANLKWIQTTKLTTKAGIIIVSYMGSGSSMSVTLEKNQSGTKLAVTYYPFAALK